MDFVPENFKGPMKKAVSIDEYLGQRSGTFIKNVEKLNEEYREIERERKERIKRVRDASRNLTPSRK